MSSTRCSMRVVLIKESLRVESETLNTNPEIFFNVAGIVHPADRESGVSDPQDCYA